MDNAQLIKRYLDNLVDISIPSDNDNISSCVVTAKEQRNILLLAQDIFTNLDNLKFEQIIGKIYNMINDRDRSHIIQELFDVNNALDTIPLARKYLGILPDEVTTALTNISQVLKGNFKLDRKVLRGVLFEKSVVCDMTYIEGYQNLLNAYLKEYQVSDKKHQLDFSDSKMKTIEAFQNKNKIYQQKSIAIIPQANISSYEIHDKTIINPLRKIIAKTYIRAALFNELNYGTQKQIFNIFAKFQIK